ncbi:ATP-binding protein, partial [Poseidonibacter sp.]|uniref:sensor histidine kinase n=1 Tax=Poseidonibacter sp. TaxID=2321188 RepID=UPI003C71597D
LTIEGIVIVKDEKIVFCNNVFKKMFGFKIEDNMINKNINELFEQTNKSSISKIINKNNSKTYEINGLKSIDNKFPTLVKSKEIFFDNNASNIISIIDMSEIKDKENILIQQSKMASLGEMIGNIAHQWRQPLSFISTSASGIKLQKEFGIIDEKEMSSTLDRITETTKFLSQTIDDFQNYLKNDKIKKEFNVNNSINTILNITKGSIVNNFINLKLDLKENLYLYGYENELNQAILNVLNNAKDALSEIDKDNRYLAIKTYKLRNRVLIEIVDNAGGINPVILDKIFEPYFTTKHKSQGTGLGLFMTHKIITESMHGQINIKNTSYTFENKKFDKCTKVVICFPIKKA